MALSNAARKVELGRTLLERYGIRVSPDSLVSALPNDQRKMVQIVKAISRRARVLLLDEPTSSLTEDEVRLVQHLIRDLAAQGTGIVFISHYLSEVFEVCDEITVLRRDLLEQQVCECHRIIQRENERLLS